jgi:hypothetical protein
MLVTWSEKWLSEKFCMNAVGRRTVPDLSTTSSTRRMGSSAGARSTPKDDSSTTRRDPPLARSRNAPKLWSDQLEGSLMA